MTEHEKRKICKKAIRQGFFGYLNGSGSFCKETNREKERLYFKNLEIVRYKDHSIAGVAVPSCYSAEGWIAIWYIEDYGKDWRLLTDEAIRRGCPVCCTELGNDDGYCPNCGQRVGD